MVTQMPEGLVEFSFYRPNADRVSLAGEFNDWHTDSLMMTFEEDGWWRCTLQLAPGFYQFRYFADSEWFTDYAAFGVEPTAKGFNSVLKVESLVVTEPVDEEELEGSLQIQAA